MAFTAYAVLSAANSFYQGRVIGKKISDEMKHIEELAIRMITVQKEIKILDPSLSDKKIDGRLAERIYQERVIKDKCKRKSRGYRLHHAKGRNITERGR